MMQICVLRKLFSLTGKYARFFVYILWIVCVLIFIIITYGIDQSSCFHSYTSLFLFGTGLFLFIAVIHSLEYSRPRGGFSRDISTTRNDPIVAGIENLVADDDDNPIFWRRLL
jgi:hypothetical protein